MFMFKEKPERLYAFLHRRNEGESPDEQKMTNKSSAHRPFSYSEKESQSNDTLLHFVEFSNVHNSDRSFNATRSNLAYKNV